VEGSDEDFDKSWRRKPKYAATTGGAACPYLRRYDDAANSSTAPTVNPRSRKIAAVALSVNAPPHARSPRDLIPVTKDARVPMKEALELFAGSSTAERDRRRANAKLKGEALTSARVLRALYVGLYFDRRRMKTGARTPDHCGREVQDRRLHVGRGRRPPER